MFSAIVRQQHGGVLHFTKIGNMWDLHFNERMSPEKARVVAEVAKENGLLVIR